MKKTIFRFDLITARGIVPCGSARIKGAPVRPLGRCRRLGREWAAATPIGERGRHTDWKGLVLGAGGAACVVELCRIAARAPSSRGVLVVVGCGIAFC